METNIIAAYLFGISTACVAIGIALACADYVDNKVRESIHKSLGSPCGGTDNE